MTLTFAWIRQRLPSLIATASYHKDEDPALAAKALRALFARVELVIPSDALVEPTSDPRRCEQLENRLLEWVWQLDPGLHRQIAEEARLVFEAYEADLNEDGYNPGIPIVEWPYGDDARDRLITYLACQLAYNSG